MKKIRFKGRVCKINGSKITIDTKPETREFVDRTTGERKVIGSSWFEPEAMPKIGAVLRIIFRDRDKQ